MHYRVQFTGTKAEKEAQALAATRDYLGIQRFNVILKELKAYFCAHKGTRSAKLRLLGNVLSMGGIEGRWCVRAMARAIAKE